MNTFEEIIKLDLYSILDVPKDAEKKTIKRNYKDLVKRLHPDKKNGNKEAFELVNLAYAILKDPDRRRVYDKKRNKKNQFQDLKNVDRKKKLFTLNKDTAAEHFKDMEDKLNKKHGYNSNLNLNNVSTKDVNRLNNDRLGFNNKLKVNVKKRNLNKNDFNQAYINENSYVKKITKEIVTYNSILTKYKKVDDYDLYSEGADTNLYSNINKVFNQKLPAKLQNHYLDHNTLPKNYGQKIKDKISEYNDRKY